MVVVNIAEALQQYFVGEYCRGIYATGHNDTIAFFLLKFAASIVCTLTAGWLSLEESPVTSCPCSMQCVLGILFACRS